MVHRAEQSQELRTLPGNPGHLRLWRGSAEDVLHVRTELVRMRQQQRYLPQFGIAERSFETRHTGEPDAVGCFPVRLSGRIVRDAFAVEQRRRFWEQATRDGRRRLSRQAVTDRTGRAINPSSGGEVRLVSLYRRVLWRVLSHRRVQRHMRQSDFSRQRV